MAITTSAKKALRGSSKKHSFNARRKRQYSIFIKEIRRLVAEKKVNDAKALLPKAYKAIDKALKTNYIKKNNASRKKSRLTLLVNKSA